jgi:hypothetical protein
MSLGKLKFAVLAPALLVLASCGGGGPTGPRVVCPAPLTVADADRLTRFKDGAGRDPRDVAYEAALLNAGSQCQVGTNVLDVTLVMIISVTAGPSVRPGTTSVPYFVRVVDASGGVVQGQDFTADFKLSAANPRGESREELSLRLPFTQVNDIGGYRIAVGLKPSQEELNYNRRAVGRP